MTAVLTLLYHSCPPHAIVAAFGLDARTVTAWLHRAGDHGAALHSPLVETGQVEGGHVQADEIRVTVRGGAVWRCGDVAGHGRGAAGAPLARRRAGTPRSGEPGAGRRAGDAAAGAGARLRACSSSRALLRCVDGFVAYVGAARSVFRGPVYTGKRGRPRLELPDGFLLAQVVKSPKGRRLAEVVRRVVVGTEEAVAWAIVATRGGTVITTSYIERLNATFREAQSVDRIARHQGGIDREPQVGVAARVERRVLQRQRAQRRVADILASGDARPDLVARPPRPEFGARGHEVGEQGDQARVAHVLTATGAEFGQDASRVLSHVPTERSVVARVRITPWYR